MGFGPAREEGSGYTPAVNGSEGDVLMSPVNTGPQGNVAWRLGEAVFGPETGYFAGPETANASSRLSFCLSNAYSVPPMVDFY